MEPMTTADWVMTILVGVPLAVIIWAIAVAFCVMVWQIIREGL
jgi:hypothetical protein